MIIFGSLTWAGFTLAVGLVFYLALGVLVTLALLRWSATVVSVSPDELTVGKRRLALDRVDEVTALDTEQTTALRGPKADPAAFMVIRPFLPESVYVAAAGEPYWLIATRHPAELAAAIETARPVRSGAGLGAACND